jgi:ABC-type nitrate/sulfonate/bicarbonate transport system substrate-binding protein
MWCKCIGVALIAGGSAMCFPLLAAAQSEIASPAGTAHADQQTGRSLLLAQHRPGPLNPRSIMQEAPTGRKQVSLMFAEATGSFLVLLEIAREQALFEKLGIDVRPVPASGATVPRLSDEVPLGLIGAPAALLQVVEGADLRLIATLSTTNLSGHLVARPGIKTAQDLRGKRLGVRVIGAGIWISTVLALEQLGLDPKRNDITLVPVGSPAQILRALELGEIDGALTAAAKSRELESRGFSVLLRDYPADITSYDGVLVARPEFVAANADVIESVTTALIEALAFALAEQNRPEVMRAFKSALNITDAATAAQNLRELRRKPYPRLDTLKRMQRIMGTHNRRVLDVALERLIDDRFVRALDETGAIGRMYGRYGVNTDFGLR